MTLRVWSHLDHVVIDLNEDATMIIDPEGLRIVMESGIGRVVVCDLEIADARDLPELIAQGLKTYA